MGLKARVESGPRRGSRPSDPSCLRSSRFSSQKSPPMRTHELFVGLPVFLVVIYGVRSALLVFEIEPGFVQSRLLELDFSFLDFATSGIEADEIRGKKTRRGCSSIAHETAEAILADCPKPAFDNP